MSPFFSNSPSLFSCEEVVSVCESGAQLKANMKIVVKGFISGWDRFLLLLDPTYDQFAPACTGKWRDLRYGTGSVSDLSIYQEAS